MSRNGSGTYSLPSGNPFVPSTVISSTTMNNTMSDIATALTQSIANDGQTTPVANLPMATFRHTNVGNAVARTDYAAAGQVQDSGLQWLTSVAGTNTITASITPSPTTYTAGQTFRFVSAGANTGATTLNINGLGAKNVTKNGSVALVAGDIASGAVVDVVYDGTQFQMSQASGAGRFLGVQVFTATGTYTPTAGTKTVVVELQGGGGAGGGSAATGVGQISIGAGGGAGGYAKSRLTSGFSGVTVTIGAAGANAVGANGGAGGASTFGGLMTANGGAGGFVDGPSAPPFLNHGYAAGGSASGGNMLNISGQPGSIGHVLAAVVGTFAGGSGAMSYFGSGSAGSVSGSPITIPVSGYGSGGAGSSLLPSSVAQAGSSGAPGVCVIYEYS